MTLDPFLLRGASLGAAWRADRGGAAGAVYHMAGSGPLPIASGLPVVATLLDLAPWELPDAFGRTASTRFGQRLRVQLLREARAVDRGVAIGRAAPPGGSCTCARTGSTSSGSRRRPRSRCRSRRARPPPPAGSMLPRWNAIAWASRTATSSMPGDTTPGTISPTLLGALAVLAADDRPGDLIPDGAVAAAGPRRRGQPR